MGGHGGLIAQGYWEILKGTYQALDRNDQMVTYLLSTGGYVDSLGGVASIRSEPVPYTRPLAHGDSGGQVLATAWKRRAWEDGVERTRAVIREMDTIRPTTGDYYSKQSFIQLARQTDPYVTQPSVRLRSDVEKYILRNILGVEMQALRSGMRRWANAK